MALDSGDDDVLVFGVTVHADILIFGDVHAFVREVCLLTAMVVVAIMVVVVD